MKTKVHKVWRALVIGLVVLGISGAGTVLAADDDELPVDPVQYPDDPIEDYDVQAEVGGGSSADAVWINFIRGICLVLSTRAG